MNTVPSTTKIKKSAKVIKYQNELSEELNIRKLDTTLKPEASKKENTR